MKKVLLLALSIMLCASLAYGQAGVVGVYADAAGATCFINSNPAGGAQIWTYVVHTLHGPTTGIGFQVIPGGGWNSALMFGFITAPYLAAGTPATGVNIGYGSCLPAGGPTMAWTLVWAGTGATPVCAFLETKQNPATSFPNVEVNDCNTPFANSLAAPDTKFWLNGDENACGPCQAVPVKAESWGKIKSLYN